MSDLIYEQFLKSVETCNDENMTIGERLVAVSYFRLGWLKALAGVRNGEIEIKQEKENEPL